MASNYSTDVCWCDQTFAPPDCGGFADACYSFNVAITILFGVFSAFGLLSCMTNAVAKAGTSMGFRTLVLILVGLVLRLLRYGLNTAGIVMDPWISSFMYLVPFTVMIPAVMLLVLAWATMLKDSGLHNKLASKSGRLVYGTLIILFVLIQISISIWGALKKEDRQLWVYLNMVMMVYMAGIVVFYMVYGTILYRRFRALPHLRKATRRAVRRVTVINFGLAGTFGSLIIFLIYRTFFMPDNTLNLIIAMTVFRIGECISAGLFIFELGIDSLRTLLCEKKHETSDSHTHASTRASRAISLGGNWMAGGENASRRASHLESGGIDSAAAAAKAGRQGPEGDGQQSSTPNARGDIRAGSHVGDDCSSIRSDDGEEEVIEQMLDDIVEAAEDPDSEGDELQHDEDNDNRLAHGKPVVQSVVV